ncbi:MAG: hypothetical protein JO279_12780 [Verrucomicrobia bacterium]|nr:hypothetical protein [Verrucomicrobiota bacterium]
MKADPGDDASSGLLPESPEMNGERSDPSVFDLLLQIEARLRVEARNEQKILKGRNIRRPRCGNLDRDGN